VVRKPNGRPRALVLLAQTTEFERALGTLPQNASRDPDVVAGRQSRITRGDRATRCIGTRLVDSPREIGQAPGHPDVEGITEPPATRSAMDSSSASMLKSLVILGCPSVPGLLRRMVVAAKLRAEQSQAGHRAGVQERLELGA
jgi:hypothetical protein